MVQIFSFILLVVLVYNRREQVNGLLVKYKINTKVIAISVCFLISLLVSIRLYHMCPFTHRQIWMDSSVFFYIGKAMNDGLVPYKDLFDHKGLILYFLNYLGCLIGHGHAYGVWIIELINMFVFSLVLFKIANLFVKSKIICYLSIFFTVLIFGQHFLVNGNYTEEYSLPWIAVSLYVVLKYFVMREYKNYQIFLMGFAFAVVFFLRANMVSVWIVFVLAVVISFIREKRYIDIARCIGLFLLGCLVVILPILIYTLLTGSFQAMIDYYFVFNLSYTGSEAGMRASWDFCKLIFSCVTIAMFFIFYSFIIHYKSKFVWLNNLAFGVAVATAVMSGREYMHYVIIIIPFFLLPTVMFFEFLISKTSDICDMIRRKSIVILLLLGCIIGLFYEPLIDIYRDIKSVPDSDDVIISYMKNNISKDSDVLILGNDAYKYLKSDRNTKNKFFYQFPPAEISEKIFDEFMSELQNKPSDYIIVEQPYKADLDSSNYSKVLIYLNGECDKGKYKLEKYDEFQVYVKN